LSAITVNSGGTPDICVLDFLAKLFFPFSKTHLAARPPARPPASDCAAFLKTTSSSSFLEEE
jgi:hypothetical protein